MQNIHERLQQSLTELETQTNNLKSIQDMYNEFVRLENKLEQHMQDQVNVTDNVEKLGEALFHTTNAYKENLDSIEQKHAELVSNYTHLKETLLETNTQIDTKLEQVEAAYLKNVHQFEANTAQLETSLNTLSGALIERLNNAEEKNQESLSEIIKEIQKNASILQHRTTELQMQNQQTKLKQEHDHEHFRLVLENMSEDQQKQVSVLTKEFSTQTANLSTKIKAQQKKQGTQTYLLGITILLIIVDIASKYF